MKAPWFPMGFGSLRGAAKFRTTAALVPLEIGSVGYR
jgi:hypothetical protein